MPAEIFRRELIPKTILAGFLATRGLRVVFGHQWYVSNAAFSNAESGDFFFVNHPIGESYRKYLLPILDRGVHIVGSEEEGVFDKFDYRKRIIEEKSEDCFSDFKLWMPWGPRDREVIKEFLNEDATLMSNGTPRSSLWGTFGNEIYEEEISIFRKRYGKFILVATSFDSGFLNHSNAASRLNKHNPAFTYDNFREVERNINNSNSLEQTIIAVNSILNRTKFNIVLRPYKTKEDKYIHAIIQSVDAKNRNRLFVDESLIISPIIQASVSVIHSGSTVGMEALTIGKMTISLSSFLNAQKEIQDLKCSDSLSKRPKGENELIQYLIGDENSVQDEMHHFVYTTQRSQFYEKLFTELIKIEPSCIRQPLNKTRPWRDTSRSQVYKTLTSIRRGKTYLYDLDKRPKVPNYYVLNFLRRSLRKFEPNLSDLNIGIIERNTYRIN